MEQDGPASGVEGRLSYRERIRVSWFIVWRAALVGAFAGVLVVPVFRLGLSGILASLGLPSEAIAALIATTVFAVQPLGVLPIVLQMLLGSQLQDYALLVERRDGAASELTYQESLAPAWLLFWRTNAILWIPATVVGVVIPYLVGSGEAQLLSLLSYGALATFGGFPLTIEMMLKKQFRVGRIVVSRAALAAGPGLDLSD